MRALFIMCEPRHREAIQKELYKHASRRLIPHMASVIDFDVEAGRAIDGQLQLIMAMTQVPLHTTDKPLVVASREVNTKLRLNDLAKASDFELICSSAGQLTRKVSTKETSYVNSLVNRCGLSVINSTAEMLQQWTHAQLGHEHVVKWLDQFGRLGGNTWIGKAILELFELRAASDLSELLSNTEISPSDVICVNREPRGQFKSADVLGNMLAKRFNTQSVYASPAEAIEQHGANSIVMFEDGLWSGTEAIGIIDSLLGRRDNRLKTARMTDPSQLQKVKIRFTYGIGTDYGAAIVRRTLKDRGLEHFEIHCTKTIQVTQDSLLTRIADPTFDMSTLVDGGPEPNELRPYVFEALKVAGMTEADLAKVADFCKTVGFQLFGNYIEYMRQTKGWSSWPVQKLANAAMGMHGLGLTHAFSHSIPKASLPLFWSKGTVKVNGKSVDWQPLIPNS